MSISERVTLSDDEGEFEVCTHLSTCDLCSARMNAMALNLAKTRALAVEIPKGWEKQFGELHRAIDELMKVMNDK